MSAGHVAFSRALIDPDSPVPEGLRSWNGSDVAQRFGVYRNNVAVSLAGVLKNSFPVVRALVGEAFFSAMARAYIAAHPPRSALMAEYGVGFPSFIARFEPAGELPYLADVGQLESARMAAYHAADAPVFGAEGFAAIAPEQLSDVRFTLHPATRILRSGHAIVSLWAAHQGEGEVAGVDPYLAEDALVTRPELDVLVTPLAPGVALALEVLAQNATLGDAVEQAGAQVEDFDPVQLFQTLVSTGAASTAAVEGKTP